MASIDPLPIELLELIVDEVSSERLTLGSCLSVSRSFRHCSLRHLYKCVEIMFDEQSREAGMSRIAALSQIISPPSRPEIEEVGRYIKTFFLSFQHRRLSTYWTSPVDTTELFRLMGNQLMGDENLLAIMNGLSGEGYGVQQFYFHIIPHMPIKLTGLPKEFCAAFQVLTQSPYLKTLQVQNMTFLPHPKIYDVRLKYLRPEIPKPELCSLEQSPGVGTDGDSNQLKRLYTDHSFPHENISSHVLRTLKKLVTYDAGPEDSAKTWEIVRMAAPSLRTICIFDSHGTAPANNLFNLGQIPNLEHFSYVWSPIRPIVLSAPNYMPTLAMLRHLLQVNQPMQFLRTLDFDIHLIIHDFATDGPHLQVNQKVGYFCKSLDAILAGNSYPLLSQIRLQIYVISPFTQVTGHHIEALTQSLEENFPCLSSSVRISFELNVHNSQ